MNVSPQMSLQTSAPPFRAVALLLCSLSVLPCLGAPPSVTNVRASQAPGSKQVTIWYDLADADSPTVRVSVQVSSDGGATWNVPAQTFSGIGYGNSVVPGRERSIHWDAGADWNGQKSSQMRFRMVATDDPIPAGMAPIPAGSFQMDDTLDGSSNALPLHSVYVSAFYIDRYEVTKMLWDDVRAWGLTHGYTDLTAGDGKAATHPIHSITWYSMVKWCNARSQKENLIPVYYTNDTQTALYQTGDVNVTNAQVKWIANGYRLPTEAVWEMAARGGLSAKRFPWGDTITHSQANYYSSTNYSYDVSPTRGYHPAYAVTATPYTSPVGSFAPNGYGLYDMAGNVWEWCWDWYGSSYYSTSPSTDPQGVPLGSYRVLRGRSWSDFAIYCRSASRDYGTPGSSIIRRGFRSVRR